MPMGSTELLSRPDKLKMLLQIPLKMRKMLKDYRMPIVELLEKLFPGDDLKGLRTLPPFDHPHRGCIGDRIARVHCVRVEGESLSSYWECPESCRFMGICCSREWRLNSLFKLSYTDRDIKLSF